MTNFDPKKHHRRSIRVPGYDYTQGWFFVTICTHQRAHLFGQVVDGAVQLSPLGALVQAEWVRTAEICPAVTLDAFVVMPNHFHGIIGLDDGSRGTVHRHVGASRRLAPTTTTTTKSPVSGSLGAIMAQFKSIVTKKFNQSQQTQGIPVWQRGYYERIIRNERELNAIRQYIHNNPARWDDDRDNLDAMLRKMTQR